MVSEAQEVCDEEVRRKLINHSLKSESQRSMFLLAVVLKYLERPEDLTFRYKSNASIKVGASDS